VIVGWAFREFKRPFLTGPFLGHAPNSKVPLHEMLNYIYGFARVAAFIGLWLVGSAFTWLLYGSLSLFLPTSARDTGMHDGTN